MSKAIFDMSKATIDKAPPTRLRRLMAAYLRNAHTANAVGMTLIFTLMLAGAMFRHDNWLAALFALTGVFFAWGVVLLKKGHIE